MNKLLLTILLMSAIWSSCQQKKSEGREAVDNMLAEIQHERDSLWILNEKFNDSTLNELIMGGTDYDAAFMKTHGDPSHRGKCAKYKQWKKDLDGR